MAIDQIPVTVRAPDDGRYLDLGLTFIPEYHMREAARFAMAPWGAFVSTDPVTRTRAVAHYFAHNVFRAHVEDAATLAREREAAKPRPKHGN